MQQIIYIHSICKKERRWLIMFFHTSHAARKPQFGHVWSEAYTLHSEYPDWWDGNFRSLLQLSHDRNWKIVDKFRQKKKNFTEEALYRKAGSCMWAVKKFVACMANEGLWSFYFGEYCHVSQWLIRRSWLVIGFTGRKYNQLLHYCYFRQCIISPH
jgi:hypothetical protein